MSRSYPLTQPQHSRPAVSPNKLPTEAERLQKSCSICKLSLSTASSLSRLSDESRTTPSATPENEKRNDKRPWMTYPLRRNRIGRTTNPVAMNAGSRARGLGFAFNGLDASFVNVPLSPSPAEQDGLSSHDRIDSIIDNALRSAYDDVGGSGKTGGGKEIYGLDMYEASQRMNAFLESTIAILDTSISLERSEMKEGLDRHQFCRACLERIGKSIEAHSDLLIEECAAYEEAASAEEERTSSILQALSHVVKVNSNSTNFSSGGDDCKDEAACQRALDSFQLEIDALASACEEQEKELRILQQVMEDQSNRSKSLFTKEDMVLHALNNLEIEAHNFGEESHLVANKCSSVMEEIDAMHRVKLISIPFDVVVGWDEGDKGHNAGDFETQNQSDRGRYPSINNLRLAYRINKKANLHRAEINSAWAQAAQLMVFACGLFPGFTSTNIRVIPLSQPCAKILRTHSDRQTVHNLGWDTLSDTQTIHVPPVAISSFLTLLYQLSSYIVTTDRYYSNGSGRNMPHLPFQMTDCTIDSIDIKNLQDSDTATWSSVIFCIAANLKWLSRLPLNTSELL